jgi:Zn-finger nucleic acid-binding protein
MNCPNDGSTLVMSERSGIEIDYCPQCRGVWLDRGELDKIIERSLGQPQPQGYTAPAAPPPTQQSYQPRYDDRGYQQGYQQPYRKKKESWLSELFD